MVWLTGLGVVLAGAFFYCWYVRHRRAAAGGDIRMLLRLCMRLMFSDLDKPAGLGIGCLNIEPDRISVAFPVSEAEIEQLILQPVFGGAAGDTGRREAVRRFFTILETVLPAAEYAYLMEKKPALSGGMLSRPVVMLRFDMPAPAPKPPAYYQAALKAAGTRLGILVNIEQKNPYYDIVFQIDTMPKQVF